MDQAFIESYVASMDITDCVTPLIVAGGRDWLTEAG